VLNHLVADLQKGLPLQAEMVAAAIEALIDPIISAE
jgi:hypothetical protein